MFRITFWWPMSLVVKKRGQTVATRAAGEGNVSGFSLPNITVFPGAPWFSDPIGRVLLVRWGMNPGCGPSP